MANPPLCPCWDDHIAPSAEVQESPKTFGKPNILWRAIGPGGAGGAARRAGRTILDIDVGVGYVQADVSGRLTPGAAGGSLRQRLLLAAAGLALLLVSPDLPLLPVTRNPERLLSG